MGYIGKSACNSRNESGGFKYTEFIVLIILFAISLMGNVFLGWKVIAQRKEIAKVNLPHYEEKTGMVLASLRLVDIGGKSTVLNFAQGHETVIYLFMPQCPWCKKNLSNIRALASQINPTIRIVGISFVKKGLEQYCKGNKLPFPAYWDPSLADAGKMDYLGTPQTLVISKSGVVLYNWLGVYQGRLMDVVEGYFHVHLPGLVQDTKVKNG